jgi:hypothetical protein
MKKASLTIWILITTTLRLLLALRKVFQQLWNKIRHKIKVFSEAPELYKPSIFSIQDKDFDFSKAQRKPMTI